VVARLLRRTLRLLVVFSFLVAAGATSAGAQTSYPPSVLGLQLSTTSGLPGSPVTVSGTGCSAGATVTIAFDGVSVGTTTAGPTGAFSTTITIPAGAKPGTHSITSSGTGCVLGSTFTVPGSAVAFTGANVEGLSAAGAGLAILGAVLVFATRRRRKLSHVD
jgi:LPXTG-motif cell wall-anchored protein